MARLVARQSPFISNGLQGRSSDRTPEPCTGSIVLRFMASTARLAAQTSSLETEMPKFPPNFRRSALVVALAASTLLTACASESTYRPAVGNGFSRSGYSDRQIEDNRFQVSFSGNSYTSRDTVEKYLLFRAAELTVQRGFDYFVFADRNVDKSTRTYATPGLGGFGGGMAVWAMAAALVMAAASAAAIGAPAGAIAVAASAGVRGIPSSAIHSSTAGSISTRSTSTRPTPRSLLARAPSRRTTSVRSMHARFCATSGRVSSRPSKLAVQKSPLPLVGRGLCLRSALGPKGRTCPPIVTPPARDDARSGRQTAPWQCLYLFPDPHGQGAFRLTFPTQSAGSCPSS